MKHYRLFDATTQQELLGIYAKTRRSALLYANKTFGVWFFVLIEAW